MSLSLKIYFPHSTNTSYPFYNIIPNFILFCNCLVFLQAFVDSSFLDCITVLLPTHNTTHLQKPQKNFKISKINKKSHKVSTPQKCFPWCILVKMLSYFLFLRVILNFYLMFFLLFGYTLSIYKNVAVSFLWRVWKDNIAIL